MVKPILFGEKVAEVYMERGYWTAETFADLCDLNAEKYPQKEAVADSRERLTWEQIKRQSDRIAFGFLEAGLKKDDLLILTLPNCVNLYLILAACEKAGIIPVGCPPTFRKAEIEPIATKTGAAGAIVPLRFRDFDYVGMIQDIKISLPSFRYLFISGKSVSKGALSLNEMRQKPFEEERPGDFFRNAKINAFELARLGATSGTTAIPKLIEMVPCSIFSAAKVWAERVRLTREDVIGALYSIVGGGVAVIAGGAAPFVGAKVALLEHFSPREACELIHKEKVTVLAGVPAAFAKILAYPELDRYDLSSLRLISNSTSMMPYKMALEMEEKFGCSVVQTYGAMDCGSICCSSVDDPRDVRLRTVGRPYNNNELKVVSERGEAVEAGEVGEVTVRGPTLGLRYFRNPELLRQNWSDGWFRVGDLGYLDEQGNLTLSGRKDDLIIRGGRNIAPKEIEELISAHPKVAEVAVVRMADRVFGEKACACVVPKVGQSVTFEEINSYLKGKNLAPFKFPERLEVLDKLPLVTAGQKVDRKKLEKYVAERLS